METLDSPGVVVPEILASHARHFARKEAVVCGGVRRTWGDFGRNIDRVANALLAAGIGRGQQVAVLMGNAVEMLELVFGVVRAGACVVPLSGLLTGEQLAGLVDNSQSVLVFASPEFRQKLAPHHTLMPGVRPDGWIAVFGEVDTVAGWRSLDSFLANAPDGPPSVLCAPGDHFNIIYSSGTTGQPKGIVQTHAARTHWAWSNAIQLGYQDNNRALTTTALYSNGTWLAMLPSLFTGGTCVVMPSFSASAFLDLVAREHISHTFMVPAQVMMLLAEPTLDQRDLSSLKSLLCGGSPLRRDTKRELLRRLGNILTELYGFSEGYSSMLKPHQHEAKFDTVGTPTPGFELRILGEDGQVLPPGEVGEIAGHGAGMMKGYHRQPELTAELVWRDERGRSFIRSGDLGVVDEEGFLRIVDRKKDMVISGGFNVFPSDLEAVVAAHPAVMDVAVIGIPHPKWGETPLALVIPQPGQTPEPAALLAWANERLAKHQRLGGVELRSEFPRNALGKVLKRTLREPYWAAETTTI